MAEDWMAVHKTAFAKDLQLVWAEVYTPEVPDTDGDFMTADEIRKASYRFMGNERLKKVDVRHDNKTYGCTIVESFIARKGDPTFIEGAWVVGIHIPSEKLWESVRKGELNGLSMQASVMAEDREIEIEIPDILKGETTQESGHAHSYSVRFDAQGNFLEGRTDVVQGHSHEIRRGTVTERSSGHRHRFSFLDILAAQRSVA